MIIITKHMIHLYNMMQHSYYESTQSIYLTLMNYNIKNAHTCIC